MKYSYLSLFLFLLCAITSSMNMVAGKANGQLDIYWVDVEGGASTLIVTPAGESVLIDSGNPGARDASRIHEVATKMAGLKQIDYLITTHFHLDHFGGAAQLAQLMPIKVVYDRGIPEQSPDRNRNDARYPLLIKPYRDMEVEERLIIQPGMQLPLKQTFGTAGVALTCVGADQVFVEKPLMAGSSVCDASIPSKPEDLSDNANSVVVVVDFGGFRFFDAGDLTWNVEKKLICPENKVGTVDVYQVTHHGLDQSNHPAVIQSLKPTVSIMNNGVTKGCGPATFAALKATSSIQAMYQVHKNLRADVENNTDDVHIANLEKDCEGHPIHLSVDSDGGAYVVALPGSGHQRRFETRAK